MYKSKIPALAFAGFSVAAGCGSEESLKDMPIDEAITTLSERACKKLKSCYPGEFSDYYSSVAECVDVYVGYLQPYASQIDAAPEACKDAGLEYLDCTTKLSCKELARGDYSDCEGEYGRFVSTCNSYLEEEKPAGPRAKAIRTPMKRIVLSGS